MPNRLYQLSDEVAWRRKITRLLKCAEKGICISLGKGAALCVWKDMNGLGGTVMLSGQASRKRRQILRVLMAYLAAPWSHVFQSKTGPTRPWFIVGLALKDENHLTVVLRALRQTHFQSAPLSISPLT